MFRMSITIECGKAMQIKEYLKQHTPRSLEAIMTMAIESAERQIKLRHLSIAKLILYKAKLCKNKANFMKLQFNSIVHAVCGL